MHVAEIALFTDDVEAVSAFYGDLTGCATGGGVAGRSGLRGRRSRRSSSTSDLPRCRTVRRTRTTSRSRYDDLDASYEALRAQRLDVLVEPRDYPWGRSAYLRDPDGRLVELARA